MVFGCVQDFGLSYLCLLAEPAVDKYISCFFNNLSKACLNDDRGKTWAENDKRTKAGELGRMSKSKLTKRPKIEQ